MITEQKLSSSNKPFGDAGYYPARKTKTFGKELGHSPLRKRTLYSARINPQTLTEVKSASTNARGFVLALSIYKLHLGTFHFGCQICFCRFSPYIVVTGLYTSHRFIVSNEIVCVNDTFNKVIYLFCTCYNLQINLQI